MQLHYFQARIILCTSRSLTFFEWFWLKLCQCSYSSVDPALVASLDTLIIDLLSVTSLDADFNTLIADLLSAANLDADFSTLITDLLPSSNFGADFDCILENTGSRIISIEESLSN